MNPPNCQSEQAEDLKAFDIISGGRGYSGEGIRGERV